MEQTANGMVTKMPMLVEGRAPETVRVSVPPQLRRRVFLYSASGRIVYALGVRSPIAEPDKLS